MKRMVNLAAAAAVALSAGAAMAADKLQIGVVTTLTTPAALLGNELKFGFDLALEHMGGKMGGQDVELLYEDDGFRPDVGKQAADKLVK